MVSLAEQLVGTEPGAARLARQAAEGRRDVVFLPADATQLPFEDGRFDIVATNTTTHHIPRWRQALGEMERVLRPGGYLIYSDFTFPTWLARRLMAVFGGRAGVFTGDELDRAFAALGLESVYKATRWYSYEAVFVK